MVFYLLTSLIFFFFILNEFKNTANLKQPSGHCYNRDLRETGPRYDHNTTGYVIGQFKGCPADIGQILLESELQLIHTVIFTDMIKEFFVTCGNNVGNPKGTHKTLYCRFILNKIVQFGCNTC